MLELAKEVWTAEVADNYSGYYMTLAPLVAGGKVLVGASGRRARHSRLRGRVRSRHRRAGVEDVHRPGARRARSDTWPAGNEWQTGGASIWVTGTYDPDTNLTFWGTGNGGTLDGRQAARRQPFTSSTVAIDAATGAIKGHFQYHPNDSWDWDEVSPPILVDFTRGGRRVKGLIDAARNGYLWFLERTDGRINFVDAKPFVKQNVFRSIDPRTGRPDVDPARKPGTGKSADFCPSHWGGKNWPPIAFSPQTRLIYIPANENVCGEMTRQRGDLYRRPHLHGRRPTASTSRPAPITSARSRRGTSTPAARVWTHTFPKSANWGPTLATGGGVVFAGGTNDRHVPRIRRVDRRAVVGVPDQLRRHRAASSFTIDGRQYVAVQSGWGIDARSMQARFNRLFPGEYPEVPEGGAIWVFGVK
jgi:alcohol dehydrogenase (cytochrome c)